MSHLKSIWCFVLAAIAGALVATSPAFGADYVVHISVDGLNASCLEDLIAADPGEFNSFKRLIDEGASTFNARTDYTYTNTLPNHTSQTTALPVSQPAGQPNTDYHGYTSNSDPGSSDTLHNSGNPNLSYIASAFDVAHDHGLSTALYASKSKFVIYEQSYNSSNGALDITGPDNGKDKIDSYVNDSSGLHADFLADMATSRFNYSWLHHRNPDDAGHGSGWCSSAWDDSIKDIDDYIGDILALIEGDGVLDGNTIIIVTTDHGGTGTGHSSASDPLNYTIPVFVWGGDVAVGTDLYALNAGVRLDPGTSRPDYNAALQPLRNGGTGNLALSALGLPAVPGSTINDSQDLIVSASSGFDEDFDSGFTTGATIGTHAAWFDDGDGPVVTASAGTAGSIGLAPADHIFTWSAHPFDWNDASLVSVTLSMDFQTSSTGLFDDDRVGWMITDDDVGSSNIFAVQLDPGPSGLNIEGYWDGSSADKRPSIVDLPALSNSTWYRLTSVITKLSPTSARIDVTFTELDGSGDPVGAPLATGSIADTSALGDDSPNSKYFTATTLWPAYKNYQRPSGGGTDGGADNTHFALSTLNQHTLSVTTEGDGSVAIDPDQALYDFGTEVTLTANPGSGETFIVWSGDLTGTDNPATVTITDDLSITASFSGSAAGEVIISGIQSYNSPSGQDPGEFIELFNTTSQTISLEGLGIISRVDNNSDGTLDVDWELAEESPDLTGVVIAPHSFYLIGESGVAGGADLTVDMDLATGEGGASERAIGIELIIDGVHQDYVLYGRDDGSSPSGDVPAGDLDPFGPYPRAEVIRNTLGGGSFSEGLLQRSSVSDLYAGYDVPGYYTDEASLGDGYPVGVWYSPHDNSDGSYTPRNATSDPVPPPCTTDIECDDSNVCTDNVCNLGSCEVSNNTDYCNDNASCTSGDVCSAGVCAGADNCAGDSACDLDTDMCVADPPAQARAAYSNTQSSSSTDGAATDTFIAAGDLEPDTDYLVIYNVGFGGSSSSDEVGARIEYGSTVWGRSVDEGNGSGTPKAIRTHQLSGFAVIAGTGTDELRIKHQIHSGTSNIKGKSIIAVPLDQLVEGSDYFVSQHNSDDIEGSTSNSATTIRSATFDLPDAGDYLVLASMEATMTNGSNSGGSLMRLQINGSTQKRTWKKEWETNNQSQNFAYARIHTLDAGENIFELEGGVSQGSKTSKFRRSRIIVIRAAVYDQMTTATTDAESATPESFETSGSQEGWDTWLTKTYTPNQAENVVVIGNGFAWQGQNNRATAARLENTTDGIIFSDLVGNNANDRNVDRYTQLVSAFENIDDTKTYAFQMSNRHNTTTDSKRHYGDLIVWSMSLAAACGDGAVDAGEDCDDGGNANGDGCNDTCSYETGACNDGLFCTSGEIWSSGVCGGGSPIDCSGSGDQCNTGTCNEAADACEGAPANVGGACGAAATACSAQDTCDSGGVCQPNHSSVATTCGDAGSECTNQDYCDGGGSCSDSGFMLAATSCGDGATTCSGQDSCDGGGVCAPNHLADSTTCGDDGSECTNQDYCDGGGSCSDSGFVVAETSCGDDATTCSGQDSCDGGGVCAPNHLADSTTCGDAGSECTNQDYCDGGGSCSDSGFVVAETSCGDDATTCSGQDSCDGGGVCAPNHLADSTTCGDAGSECTNQDYCDGGGSCSDNGFMLAATSCGDDATTCSGQDSCDGAGTCQDNHLADSTTCGDAGSECTNQDYCDGGGSCGDSGFVAAATSCGDDATTCSGQDSCDGGGVCAPNHLADSTTCGDAGSECTNQDYCDGGGSCGDSGFVAAATSCGDDATTCSGQDSCDGGGVCAPNHLADSTTCGDAGSECTNQDYCDGGGSCGDSGFVVAETSCGDDATTCSGQDSCDGGGVCAPNHLADSTTCGDAGSECTNQDYCDGGGSCSDSGFVVAETSCGDDATTCSGQDSCDGGGVCAPNHLADSTTCGDAGSECTNQDYCDGGGSCSDSGFVVAATSCGDDATTCSGQDSCDGAGTCQDNHLADSTTCGDAGSECTNQDYCDGGGSCGDSGFVAAATSCGDDATTCSGQDSCDGGGVCAPNHLADSTTCGDAGSECTNQDYCDGGGSCGDSGFVVAETSCGDDATTCSGQDSCDGGGVCAPNHLADSTTCGDAGSECTNQDYCDGGGSCSDSGFVVAETSCGDDATTCSGQDSCDGGGVCAPNHLADSTTCGDAGSECTNQDYCDGGGSCSDNGFMLAATSCGDDATTCSGQDSCDGAGTCQDNHLADSTTCGDAGSECTNQDYCDGGGSCGDSGFVAAATSCGDDATTCSGQDSCDGGGVCAPNHLADSTTCGDDGSECTNQDYCDGGGSCGDSGFVVAATSCGDDATTCSGQDSCDGGGVCAPNHLADTATCGDDGSECTNQDYCDGGGSCSDSGFVVAATSCGDDATTCSGQDSCDGGGVCAPNHLADTATCGDDGSECTNQDYCDGGGSCGDSGFVVAETSCGDDATTCSGQDSCDGGGVCAPNHLADTATCGDDGSECTNQDYCDGGGSCSDSGFVVAETSCGDDATTCSGQDSCDGGGVCAPNHLADSTTCGDAGSECTNQDYCDGGGSCSDNGFMLAATSCGDDATTCSGQDSCDGAGTCQDNHLADSTTCGDAGSECTNQDYCDGGGSCGDSGFVAAATSCGDDATTCSGQDSCDGGGVCAPNHLADSTTCGDAGSECTNQDYCDGGGSCSDSGFVVAATSCGDDATTCSGQDSCDGGGVCAPNHLADTATCGDDGSECTNQDYCDGGGSCGDSGFVVAATSCGDDATTCSGQDSCDGGGVCAPNHLADTATCGDDGSECTNQDYCDGGGSCSDSGFVVAATSCGDDATTCSGQDSCDGGGVCAPNHLADTATCGDDGSECTNQDYCDGGGSCGDSGFVVAETSCGDDATTCSGQDSCDGGGVCAPNHLADTATCGDDGSECTNQDYCDGGGSCSDSGFVVAETSCGDDATTCSDQDSCDGAGTCQDNHLADTATCGDDGSECTNQDYCDGGGSCSDSGFVVAETSCGDDATTCSDQDSCDGAGTCQDNHLADTATCGDDGSECTNQDYCDGGGSCGDSGFVVAETSCGDGAMACSDQDSCDGAGTCQANHLADTATCGDDGSECTNQDYCDGGGSCDDGGFMAAETSCGDGAMACSDQDSCDGAGTCQANHLADTTTCGDDGSECTNQDYCDGGGSCDDGGFMAAETSCGDGATTCSGEDSCDGAGTCQANHLADTATCGDDGSECTNQDYCDGGGSCDDGGFVAAETSCGDGAMACSDQDSCDGAGTCQANHLADTATCGDDGSECTNQDYCDGGGSCGDSGFVAAETSCGDGATTCSGEDSCDGGGVCAPNHVADTTSCSDDDPLTYADQCNAGVCEGSSAPPVPAASVPLRILLVALLIGTAAVTFRRRYPGPTG